MDTRRAEHHFRDRTGAGIERALTEGAANEYESGLMILEDWMVLILFGGICMSPKELQPCGAQPQMVGPQRNAVC